MNRIEPIGPPSDDVPVIAPIPRRAPDRERDEERQRRRRTPAPPAEPVAHRSTDEDGEHVDVRA
jgi:hypothetical protein